MIVWLHLIVYCQCQCLKDSILLYIKAGSSVKTPSVINSRPRKGQGQQQGCFEKWENKRTQKRYKCEGCH